MKIRKIHDLTPDERATALQNTYRSPQLILSNEVYQLYLQFYDENELLPHSYVLCDGLLVTAASAAVRWIARFHPHHLNRSAD